MTKHVGAVVILSLLEALGVSAINFYKRHLGDIAKATSHLSQGQMGAYDLLLDWVYANEKCIPLSAVDVYRIARGYSRVEKLNIDKVLSEFFIKTPDGYTQKRVLEEMAKANAQAENNRIIALQREAQKRARTVHESCNESLDVSYTNREPSQTPDSRLEQDQQISTANAVEVINRVDDLLGGIIKKVSKRETCPVAAIVALYDEILPKHPRMEKITSARAGRIRARWAEDLPTLDAWRNFFLDVANSRFLTGRVDPPPGRRRMVASLDWITKADNFAKILEGEYHR